MQGIYVNGKRPPSKKAVREALAAAPSSVVLEDTSLFGDEQSGSVKYLPDGRYSVVGPDPYTSRKFYGTLIVKGGVAEFK